LDELHHCDIQKFEQGNQLLNRAIEFVVNQ
ncbi:type 1 glutamine amidotransferase, partial [Acinetobacter baumannii]|nr:type 1 glutamine amidotransferase [Acinetobacter baumannii]